MDSGARGGFSSWLHQFLYDLGKSLSLSVSPFIMGMVIVLTCPGPARSEETVPGKCLAWTLALSERPLSGSQR